MRKFLFRISLIAIFMLVTAGIFIAALYTLQVVEGEENRESSNTYTYYTSVAAARGSMFDRNGNVLVSNRVSYNAVLISFVLYSSEDINGTLLDLVALCHDNDIDYIDTLPITTERPYTYTVDDLSAAWQNYYLAFLRYMDLDGDMTAENLIRRLKSKYDIPEEYTEEQARAVIGLRYELSVRNTVNSLGSYVLAEDLDAAQLASLTERNIPGLTIETTTVREYHTNLASHLLGRVGPMDPDEYAELKDEGYAMNARIGKDGAEAAFESYLRGVDGTRVTTVSSTGQVLEEYYLEEPKAGGNVYLSIDIGMQQYAEAALEETILNLRSGALDSGEGMDAGGGAVVVMKVDTGEMLTAASYPYYDLSTYSQDFNALMADENAPLYNRFLSAFPPGSTYKMVTTIAAIDYGVINANTIVEDHGRYEYYDTYQPTCLLYSKTGVTHGSINVMQALAASCNYYFYDVGRRTGIQGIDTVARSLGLGEATGIELPESTGSRDNPEYRSEIGGEWYDGTTLAVSIGQGDNAFTPLQLACYTSALATGGTRYRATLLKRVVSAGYEDVLYEATPTIASSLAISDEAQAAYTNGMRMAVTDNIGTATYFRDYGIAVAAKTGTAQHGSGGSDHAAFVCYAPFEDPEIAVVIYVEKGAQGGLLAPVAEAVFNYYFAQTQTTEVLPPELVVK